MCGCKNRIAGMARNRMSRKITGTLTTGAKVAVGYVAGKALVSKIPFFANNPGLGIAAQVGGAILTKNMMKNATGVDLATGMVVGAVIDAVKLAVPSVASQVGISGFTDYSASTRVPGIAGGGDYSVPMVAMG